MITGPSVESPTRADREAHAPRGRLFALAGANFNEPRPLGSAIELRDAPLPNGRGS